MQRAERTPGDTLADDCLSCSLLNSSTSSSLLPSLLAADPRARDRGKSRDHPAEPSAAVVREALGSGKEALGICIRKQSRLQQMELFKEHLGKNNEAGRPELGLRKRVSVREAGFSRPPGQTTALGALCPWRPRPTDTLLRAGRGTDGDGRQTGGSPHSLAFLSAGGQRKLETCVCLQPRPPV